MCNIKLINSCAYHYILNFTYIRILTFIFIEWRSVRRKTMHIVLLIKKKQVRAIIIGEIKLLF